MKMDITLDELKFQIKCILLKLGIKPFIIRKSYKMNGVLIYRNKGEKGLFIEFTNLTISRPKMLEQYCKLILS